MLRKVLSLLPAAVVEQIGNASFQSLADRGEVDSWEVAYEPEGSIARQARLIDIDTEVNQELRDESCINRE